MGLYQFLKRLFLGSEPPEEEKPQVETVRYIPTELDLKKQYGKIPIEEIMFNDMIHESEKKLILSKLHGYSEEEAEELLQTAISEKRRAKLIDVKRKITSKALEIYSQIPINERQPISDDVKLFVWQRDGGKCVRCGSQENLEYDHIIPVSKGGSSTKRNVQLLCEKCNRTKRDRIVF